MTARAPETRPGVNGGLVSESFAEQQLGPLFGGQLGEATRNQAGRLLRTWRASGGRSLGPASGLRAIADKGAVPVMNALGFRVSPGAAPAHQRVLPATVHGSGVTVALLVTPWGEPLDHCWPDLARQAVRVGGEWAFCFNGSSLRLCDVARPWARAFLEFDLDAIAAAPASLALFWGLLRADALGGLTRRVADESARHGVAVRASLRDGVRDALALLLEALLAGSRRAADAAHRDDTFEQALTIIYRILFLLFAESRGLVPVWHPVYRDSYTIDALRSRAEAGRDSRGMWEALQALSRLAHAGCRAGTLRVTPFNGRLFSPSRTPLAEIRRLDDRLVAGAIVALTSRPTPQGRERISFRDLGVEQLGAVYESVLDYEPAVTPAARSTAGGPRRDTPLEVTLVPQRDRRKASGTFYTPQGVTDYLVRQTLHPLVSHATADHILALRVLDPAMGSGAFLVAACRYLAGAYERAIVRERGWLAADVTDADRAGYRRLIAQRCLYGVDVNPMAVQVARLSLWLATLSADRPLTFLDHRLAAGDSLVGASLDDLARQAPGDHGAARTPSVLPLFEGFDAGSVLGVVLPVRDRLARGSETSAGSIHEKERMLADLWSPGGPLAALKSAADLWCACWFWDGEDPPSPGPREHADLVDGLLHDRSVLPKRLVEPRLARARHIASERRFFHWTLEFPEVFFARDGQPATNGGFDAVIGNPPWEMLRGDNGAEVARSRAREAAGRLTRFARSSGIYRSCGEGHANQYQLFVERSLQLAKRGGRVGLIVPWGLASDHGSASLRRRLFEECDTERLVGFENSAAIFPIHRGVRFLLLSTTTARPTRQTRCRFGLRDPVELERRGAVVTMTPRVLRRLAGPGLAIPHVRGRRDRQLAERLVSDFPALGDPRGWGASFGRELNATDDARAFTPHPTGIPIVEGKHIDPFVARVSDSARWLADSGLLDARGLRARVSRPRLAYRDVAASTNRLTLIAAVLPRDVVAVHTLFCLRTSLSARDQAFLCGMLNSFVANYLVRLWVTTHLGSTTVERLPVPRPAAKVEDFRRVAALARTLSRGRSPKGPMHMELQARAARLYGLSRADLALVLESFPLVDEGIRDAVMTTFEELAGTARGV